MIIFFISVLILAGYLMYIAWKSNQEVKEIREKNKEYAKWQEMYYYQQLLDKRIRELEADKKWIEMMGNNNGKK